MLELNIGNKITFVVERINTNLLMKCFDFFSTGLNELDLIKFKIPSEAELNDIVEGNRKLYKDRIEDRLYCRICNSSDVTNVEGIPNSTSLLCLYYIHPLYVTEWKNTDLTKGYGEGYPNECFVCGGIISNKHTDVYGYHWNLNETLTKSLVNKRCKIAVDMNLISRLPT